jgi:uncharacterized protein involved in exopolysaccharide biosynthesis/Mrp family chromosome partitioning ATPase
MNDTREIQKLLQIVKKGWKALALFLGVALFLGGFFVYRATPSYQAQATLKINDKESGSTEFWEEFESFSNTGNLLTEVEVIKSRYLVGRALEKLDFNIQYYQNIRGTLRELYHRSPFHLRYELTGPEGLDKTYTLKYTGPDSLYLVLGERQYPINWGEMQELPGIRFQLFPDSTQAYQLQVGGTYAFELLSEGRLVEKYAGSDLTVKLLDKDISIVKIYFRHKVPLKAQRFVNALAEAYIEDFIESKAEAAEKALRFIDEELKVAAEELGKAERSIERYKAGIGTFAPKQEAADNLQQIQELEQKKWQLGLQQNQLGQLRGYLMQSADSSAQVPDFGSLQDPFFNDALLKIRSRQSQKREKLLRFTPDHPEVKMLSKEIQSLRGEVLSGIENTFESFQQQEEELRKKLRQAQGELSTYPVVERELLILNRRFEGAQRKYEFLQQKREEAAIGSAATIAFHKILERAELPRSPLSTQKKVVLVISMMLGSILGMTFLLVRQYLKGTVVVPSELELLSEGKIAGKLEQKKGKKQALPSGSFDLASALQLSGGEKIISVTSWESGAGKSTAAYQLARAYAEMGQQCLLVDANLYQPAQHERMQLPVGPGFAEWSSGLLALDSVLGFTDSPQLDLLTAGQTDAPPAALFMAPGLPGKLAELSQRYDKVIIDAPSLKGTRDMLPLLQVADLSLFVARAGKSARHGMREAEQTLNDFSITNYRWLWNE